MCVDEVLTVDWGCVVPACGNYPDRLDQKRLFCPVWKCLCDYNRKDKAYLICEAVLTQRRSVDNVIEELIQLKDTYKVNYVEIMDGTFTFDRKYVQQFCNTMIDRKLNVEWRCTARYDNLDEELIKLMKRANCTGMYLGFESGSDKVLQIIDKKTSVEKNIKISEIVYKSGIPSGTGILLGLPDEGKEDM